METWNLTSRCGDDKARVLPLLVHQAQCTLIRNRGKMPFKIVVLCFFGQVGGVNEYIYCEGHLLSTYYVSCT